MNPILRLALKEILSWLENHPDEIKVLVDEGFNALVNWVKQQSASK